VANEFIVVYILVNLFVGIMLSATEEVFEEDEQRKRTGSQEPQKKTFAGWVKRKLCWCLQFEPDAEDGAALEQPLLTLSGPTLDRHGDRLATWVDAPPIPKPPTKFERFQRILRTFLQHPLWDSLVILVILLSTFALALQSPITSPKTRFNKTLILIDRFTTFFFVFEVFLRCLAHGVIVSPKSYLRRSGWNVLDFFIVAVSLLDFTLDVSGVQVPFSVIKGFYTLRPLRFMRRSTEIKLVLKSLARAVPAIKDVMIVAGLVWVIYAIFGMQLFMGDFHSCSDPTILNETACVNGTGNAWVNAPYSFDNLAEAMLSLFVVASFEGWAPIMHNAIDAVGPGQGPSLNNSPASAVYFVAFSVIGGFFLVNLFVSVLIGTYEKQKKSLSRKHLFLTPAQTAWLESQHQVLSALPVAPFMLNPDKTQRTTLERIRAPLLHAVCNPIFDHITNLLVIGNFIFMCLYYYPASETLIFFLNASNYAFVAIFSVEALVKMFALGPRFYFGEQWNRFDFIVVLVSIAGAISEVFFSRRSFGSVFRTLRIIRLVRVVRGAKRVQRLISKFSVALVSLGNVAALVFLCFCVFGLITMQLFGRLKPDGEVIDQNSNFSTLPRSMAMLFRIATGGGWPDVLAACRVQPPDCDPNIGECGWPIFAPIFFVFFIIIGTYTLLNVFVAVIMDSFSADEDDDDEVANTLSEAEAAELVRLWMYFDRKRALQISSTDAILLIRMLPPDHPFALRVFSERRRRICELRYFKRLKLTDLNGKVEFLSLMTALFRGNFRIQVNDSVLSPLQERYRKAFKDRLRAAGGDHSTFVGGVRRDLSQYLAGVFIVDVFRQWKANGRKRPTVAKLVFDETKLTHLHFDENASSDGNEDSSSSEDEEDSPLFGGPPSSPLRRRSTKRFYDDELASGAASLLQVPVGVGPSADRLEPVLFEGSPSSVLPTIHRTTGEHFQHRYDFDITEDQEAEFRLRERLASRLYPSLPVRVDKEAESPLLHPPRAESPQQGVLGALRGREMRSAGAGFKGEPPIPASLSETPQIRQGTLGDHNPLHQPDSAYPSYPPVPMSATSSSSHLDALAVDVDTLLDPFAELLPSSTGLTARSENSPSSHFHGVSQNALGVKQHPAPVRPPSPEFWMDHDEEAAAERLAEQRRLARARYGDHPLLRSKPLTPSVPKPQRPKVPTAAELNLETLAAIEAASPKLSPAAPSPPHPRLHRMLNQPHDDFLSELDEWISSPKRPTQGNANKEFSPTEGNSNKGPPPPAAARSNSEHPEVTDEEDPFASQLL
jgi:hypothetical protein